MKAQRGVKVQLYPLWT